MKIYTKQGDDGLTGLVGGRRVSKDDARIEAYGTLDELSAVLGVACENLDATAIELVRDIQRHLFVVGADLATPDQTSPSTANATKSIEQLEAVIDRYEAKLQPLTNFILPGGHGVAARLHVARTTCRRGERRVVTLGNLENVDPLHIVYLNRLSDLLFVMARRANLAAGMEDIAWIPADD